MHIHNRACTFSNDSLSLPKFNKDIASHNIKNTAPYGITNIACDSIKKLVLK